MKSRLLPAWHVATEVSECLLKALKQTAAFCVGQNLKPGADSSVLIYKLIDEGKFARPVRIGIRAVGGDSIGVEQWIADRSLTSMNTLRIYRSYWFTPTLTTAATDRIHGCASKCFRSNSTIASACAIQAPTNPTYLETFVDGELT